MPMSILFTLRTRKDLRDVPQTDRRQLLDRIESYAATGTGDVAALKGSPGSFRLRWGDWRVIFSVDGTVMTIKRVRHRREVYR
jgi:mRNA interferase RelE/StbE